MPKDSGQIEDDFLQLLGKQVRSLRASRGMTRKMLAVDSSVSERYLAKFELGKGNISINLLRQVAQALGVRLTELLADDGQYTPEQSMINEFVGRLSPAEQRKTLQGLYQKFSCLGNEEIRIAFIGLRGAGKSTLGKMLEEHNNLRLIKLAHVIESFGGMAVPEILSLSGQAGYRRLEKQALFRTLNENSSCCIETGSSIVSEPKVLNILLTTCFVIWVKATPEEHLNRVMAQGNVKTVINNKYALDDLCNMMDELQPYYQHAHAELNTSGKSEEESYNELINIINENHYDIRRNKVMEGWSDKSINQ